MVVSFSSTTIKRVCCATLQAALVVLAEIYGFGSQGAEWETLARRRVPHTYLTDCGSLADRLKSDALAGVKDKRLQIELSSLRQSIFTEDGERTCGLYPGGGDSVEWIGSIQSRKRPIASRNQCSQILSFV